MIYIYISFFSLVDFFLCVFQTATLHSLSCHKIIELTNHNHFVCEQQAYSKTTETNNPNNEYNRPVVVVQCICAPLFFSVFILYFQKPHAYDAENTHKTDFRAEGCSQLFQIQIFGAPACCCCSYTTQRGGSGLLPMHI